jgi:HK97 family phage major capsid protein
MAALTCIRDLQVNDHGLIRSIRRGAVVDDDEITERYPQHFAPNEEAGRQQRLEALARSRAPGTYEMASFDYGRNDGSHRRRSASFDYAAGRSEGASPREIHRTEAVEGALRTLESYHADGVLPSESACAMEDLVKGPRDPFGLGASYLEAVGDPAYESAFGKLLADPNQGHLRFSPEEVLAVRRVGQVELQRGMVEGTPSAGGFGVPLVLDPTILLSGAGAFGANAVRSISRVETIISDKWQGVSSDGVTVAYQAEAAEVADNTPTLAGPTVDTATWRGFVPYSVELDMDWRGLQAELTKLIADARDVNDATQFLTGATGGVSPEGIITGTTTGQRVLTATTAAYAVADPYTLKQAVPARFQGNTTFAANPTTWDTTFRFVGTNSSEPLQFDSGRGGNFLGRPKIEWSTMATGASTGTKLMLAGDFRAGFLIVDRLGLTAEIVPHLFGASRRPTGERGLFVMGRTGSKLIIPNAIRYLEVK